MFVGRFTSSNSPVVRGTITVDLADGTFTLEYTGSFRLGTVITIKLDKSTKCSWNEGKFTGTRHIFIPGEVAAEQMFMFTIIEYLPGKAHGFYACIYPADHGVLTDLVSLPEPEVGVGKEE